MSRDLSRPHDLFDNIVFDCKSRDKIRLSSPHEEKLLSRRRAGSGVSVIGPRRFLRRRRTPKSPKARRRRTPLLESPVSAGAEAVGPNADAVVAAVTQGLGIAAQPAISAGSKRSTRPFH